MVKTPVAVGAECHDVGGDVEREWVATLVAEWNQVVRFYVRLAVDTRDESVVTSIDFAFEVCQTNRLSCAIGVSLVAELA